MTIEIAQEARKEAIAFRYWRKRDRPKKGR